MNKIYLGQLFDKHLGIFQDLLSHLGDTINLSVIKVPTFVMLERLITFQMTNEIIQTPAAWNVKAYIMFKSRSYNGKDSVV